MRALRQSISLICLRSAVSIWSLCSHDCASTPVHLQADLARHSSAFVGKVRSNFIGTEFTCYDSGVSPAKASGTLRSEHCLHANPHLVCADACC